MTEQGRQRESRTHSRKLGKEDVENIVEHQQYLGEERRPVWMTISIDGIGRH